MKKSEEIQKIINDHGFTVSLLQQKLYKADKFIVNKVTESIVSVRDYLMDLHTKAVKEEKENATT